MAKDHGLRLLIFAQPSDRHAKVDIKVVVGVRTPSVSSVFSHTIFFLYCCRKQINSFSFKQIFFFLLEIIRDLCRFIIIGSATTTTLGLNSKHVESGLSSSLP